MVLKRRVCLCLALAAAAPASAGVVTDAWLDGDGLSLTIMAMDSGPAPTGDPGPPVPAGAPGQHLLAVPTSTWSYGCSATSAGMIFGYYDRNGYGNMYTGPANGGVAPLTNLGPGIGAPLPGSTSLIVTMNGFDGRLANGHVDDYWIGVDSPGPDPWQGHWAEHARGDCTADFMGTNQWKWDTDTNGSIDFNVDGSTMLFMLNSADALHDYVPPAAYGMPQTALTHGMRLFAESRGYDVADNYTQRVDTLYPGGFSFADFAAEIDAGRPVMVQVVGHSMVGVGYDDDGSTIYIHDTWDNSLHSMTWGGSYSGMALQAITVFQMASAAMPEPAACGLIATLAAALCAWRRRAAGG
ncbi:MAG: hypothetical protein GX591_04280 [Planctomycetes bacterium]|nr:hypothetical protein [Planctomycetota bacterium]